MHDSDDDLLRRALEDAESKNATRMLFLARLSHEVRTPLNGILGFAELLESDPADTLTPRQREHVQQIRKGGAQLLKLVNDVLELARSDSGQLALQNTPINLPRLLQEAVTFLQPTANHSDVELKVHCDPAIAIVSGDPTRLLQVLNNLLTNAIKYTCPGGTVELSAVCRGQDDYELRVSDTGIGIPPEKQPEIFDMFVRGDNGCATDQRGYGIGLAVTRGLVEQMGGTIAVKSAPGEGSTFSVRLPCDHPGK
ncbi:sensor histidine kinase [Aquisalimonas asiatica]|uniref:histidine kinase n=1 Tax=Aquisalimonas asiatica TaxID=406100 RepID=A0A1H8QEY4_9GAMM|nr:HAMP domain-containing sensor histidine kinase [Aquisalimonas asiatica]SEO52333.1 His Kinase A (phospho-acceptor) domain-containing protein [Aquisalimonas asiatica]